LFNNKKAMRVIALVLAVLMVLGIAVIAIEALANSSISENLSEENTEQTIGGDSISAEGLLSNLLTQTPDSSLELSTVTSELPSGYSYLTDPKNSEIDVSELLPHLDVVTHPIRVGVFYIYGSNNCLAFSHNISSSKGLALYSVFDDKYTFYEISNVGITVMRDFSAKKNSANSYYHTTEGNTHIIYHCVTSEPVPLLELDATIENYKSILGQDATVFPLYVSGKAYIAVGTYPNKDASIADCENMKSKLGVDFVARTPNNTSISVVETVSGKILFKIDTADQALYVRPVQNKDSNSTNYIKSAVGNIFDGTFEYKTTINGMYLVNILDIDDYVKSVLPYEISASWPDECLKAFSVVVRSYTLAMQHRNHRNQDFDMCDETHCQAYRGRLRSTTRTDAAVDSTENTVLAYNSKICQTFYHAISGGITESAEAVWGGSGYDYLVSQVIPDEKYQNYTNGVWKFEVSETELFNYLQNNSTVSKYVKNPITSVRISKYTDAGYAYELEITDSSGTVSTFTKCDNVRTILSKYCKSARLTIGKSTEVTVNGGEKITVDPYNVFQTDKDGNIIRVTAAAGTNTTKTVISGTGTISNLSADKSTYIISGTGWGHGVGLSQYGARDMANNGYAWQEIATYFFPKSYLAKLHDLSKPIYPEEDLDEPELPIEPEEPQDPDDPDDNDDGEEDPGVYIPPVEEFKPIVIV